MGLKGLAALSGGSALLAFVNPEPVSKTILAIIAGICFALGAYFVYLLIQMLISNKYKFTLKRTGQNGDEWEFEAGPA